MSKPKEDVVERTDEMLERRTCQEVLPVKLEPNDKLERGEKIAKNLGEIDGVLANLKEHQTSMKAKVETLTRENSIMAMELRQGTRQEIVEIEEVKDFREGRVSTTRLDTNEIFATREMSPG